MECMVDVVKRKDGRKPQCPGIDTVRRGMICVAMTRLAEYHSLCFVREMSRRKMELMWIGQLCHDFELHKPCAHPNEVRFQDEEVVVGGFGVAALPLECYPRFLIKTGRGSRPSHIPKPEASMNTEGADTPQWIQDNIPGADRNRATFTRCVGGRELRVVDTTTQFGTAGYVHGMNTNEKEVQQHVLTWKLNKVGKQWVVGSKLVVKTRPGEKQKPQEAPDLGDPHYT